MKHIAEAIDDHRTRVVSFDVFDTLLARPVLEPADLFHLVEAKARARGIDVRFATLRRQAERAARVEMRRVDPGREEPTLDAIHAALRALAELDAATSETLRELEIEAEQRILRARKSVIPLVEHARGRGVEVVAMTDVYLPEAVVRGALARCGLGDLERCWVSSESGETKGSGRLYRRMLADLRCDPSSVVHVGDRRESDVVRARALGLRAFHVPTARYLFFRHSPFATLWADGRDVLPAGFRMLLGMIINERFDAHEAHDPDELVGYLAGPFALAPGGEGHPALRSPPIARGTEAFLRDARALFGDDLHLLDVPAALARRPLEALERAASIPWPRRLELFLLAHVLAPSQYLRLHHSPGQFFAEAQKPWWQAYGRGRRLIQRAAGALRR